jgi:HTH-type transcriptional regulator / antitoxin HigA
MNPNIINSESEYQAVMERVESYLQKATQHGGFHALEPAERLELQQLSLIAEAWEDQVPVMPL